jgi:hypothetical protein
MRQCPSEKIDIHPRRLHAHLAPTFQMLGVHAIARYSKTTSQMSNRTSVTFPAMSEPRRRARRAFLCLGNSQFAARLILGPNGFV